jgi:hypothetical protein
MDSVPRAKTITTISSRTFNHDVGGAKRAAVNGPVFITDRGKTSHVLLTIEAYQKLQGETRSIADMLAQKEGEYFEFDPPRFEGPYKKPFEFD